MVPSTAKSELGIGFVAWPLLEFNIGVPHHLPERVGVVTHALTHRRYTFEVLVCSAGKAGMTPETPQVRRWVTAAELDAYPLPLLHVKAARMAGV